MLQGSVAENRRSEVEAHIHAAIMNAFCEMMRRSGLSPIEVMGLTAQAVGTIYREVAEAHSGPDCCPCGWQPHEIDIGMLCDSLSRAARRDRRQDLRLMRVAGMA